LEVVTVEARISGRSRDISALRNQIVEENDQIIADYVRRERNTRAAASSPGRYYSTLSTSSELLIFLGPAGVAATVSRILVEYIRSRRTTLKLTVDGVELQIDSSAKDLQPAVDAIQRILSISEP